MRFARLLPKLITFEPPPCTWFIRKIQKPNRSTNGSSEVRIDHHGDEPVPLESNVTFFFWSRFWNGDLRLVARVVDLATSCPRRSASR